MNQPLPLSDRTWMQRCFDLAARGFGHVSPNPPVGAVLVHDNQILGEGFHRRFGGPHAEVEAVQSVPEALRHLIPEATLYVSLEPCCVFGKTPPCTNLILTEGIRDVRISARDPNPEVAGEGIRILQEAGVNLTEGILEDEGRHLIRSFTTNILQKRPHIILKWAQSQAGYTGIHGQSVWLSDPLTRVWTHRQRTETDAILVGARTIETDDPALTTRHFPGTSPQRVIFDPSGRLHGGYKVFARDGIPVWYFSAQPNPRLHGLSVRQYVWPPNAEPLTWIIGELFRHQIGLVLVEGGAFVQQKLIEQGLWDEAWVIRTLHPLDHGIRAPAVRGYALETIESGSDMIIGIANR